MPTLRWAYEPAPGPSWVRLRHAPLPPASQAWSGGHRCRPGRRPLEVAPQARADRVRWCTDATALPRPGRSGDPTGTWLRSRTDEEWAAALRAAQSPRVWAVWCLRAGTRAEGVAGVEPRPDIPACRHPARPRQTWIDLTKVGGTWSPSGRRSFGSDSAVLTWTRLRFRGRAELENSLTAASLAVDESGTPPPAGALFRSSLESVTTCQFRTPRRGSR
jgi:hypothetical protein